MDSTAHGAQLGHASGNSRAPRLLQAGLLLLCIAPVFLMWDLTRALFGMVLKDPTYSHLPFIPLMSAFFIYMEQDAIFANTSRGWRAGSCLALAGAISLLLTQANPWQWNLADRLSLMGLGLALLAAGAFVLLFGNEAARAAGFPLLLLLFAVPVPEWLLSRSVYLLQAGSAQATEVLFKLIGIPFYRSGFDFMLPTVTIRIAEECSGIRSTLALLLTSAAAGHLFLKSNLGTAMLCLLTIPISILKNGFRIATLSYLGMYVDPSFLYGWLHRQGGIVFFLLGLLLIGLALVVLRKLERPPSHRHPGLELP